MKKIILSTVAVFAFGFANAQQTKFGVKAGLNIANFSGDVEDNSSKVGLAFGGFVEIKVSDKFAIQPEVLFSAQGAKSSSEDGKLNLSYLNIPIMAKFYVAEKFNLEAGPQLGFLVSAKTKYDGNSEDVKKYYNSTDFGLNLGAGYDVSKNIAIGVRYSAGLSNIVKDSGDDKVRNSNIAISLGYKF